MASDLVWRIKMGLWKHAPGLGGARGCSQGGQGCWGSCRAPGGAQTGRWGPQRVRGTPVPMEHELHGGAEGIRTRQLPEFLLWRAPSLSQLIQHSSSAACGAIGAVQHPDNPVLQRALHVSARAPHHVWPPCPASCAWSWHRAHPSAGPSSVPPAHDLVAPLRLAPVGAPLTLWIPRVPQRSGGHAQHLLAPHKAQRVGAGEGMGTGCAIRQDPGYFRALRAAPAERGELGASAATSELSGVTGLVVGR